MAPMCEGTPVPHGRIGHLSTSPNVAIVSDDVADLMVVMRRKALRLTCSSSLAPAPLGTLCTCGRGGVSAPGSGDVRRLCTVPTRTFVFSERHSQRRAAEYVDILLPDPVESVTELTVTSILTAKPRSLHAHSISCDLLCARTNQKKRI